MYLLGIRRYQILPLLNWLAGCHPSGRLNVGLATHSITDTLTMETVEAAWRSARDGRN